MDQESNTVKNSKTTSYAPSSNTPNQSGWSPNKLASSPTPCEPGSTGHADKDYPMGNSKPSYEELQAENKNLKDQVKRQNRLLDTEKKRVEFLGKAASFFAAENYDPGTGSK